MSQRLWRMFSQKLAKFGLLVTLLTSYATASYSADRHYVIKNPTNTSIAIFVHGFRGEYVATWGKLPEGRRFQCGEGSIATEMRYAFGIPRQGFQRRRIPDAMPQRQHTA